MRNDFHAAEFESAWPGRFDLAGRDLEWDEFSSVCNSGSIDSPRSLDFDIYIYWIAMTKFKTYNLHLYPPEPPTYYNI